MPKIHYMPKGSTCELCGHRFKSGDDYTTSAELATCTGPVGWFEMKED